MAQAGVIKPTHPAIRRYYECLKRLSGAHVTHELGLRTAFGIFWKRRPKLTAGRLSRNSLWHGHPCPWLLTAWKAVPLVRPDGTVRDGNSLPRGYWEAKDTGDALDREIAKKKAKGYPLSNIIFEDTATAVLYQNKLEVMRVDLRDRQKLADLLNHFYSYAEPEIERFDHAVAEFKTRVPELAQGLAGLIAQAHADNRKFAQAFGAFLALCQTAINPNLSRAPWTRCWSSISSPSASSAPFSTTPSSPGATPSPWKSRRSLKRWPATPSTVMSSCASWTRSTAPLRKQRARPASSPRSSTLSTRCTSALPGLLRQGGRHARHCVYAAADCGLYVRQRGGSAR